jgi:hypothetical protein
MENSSQPSSPSLIEVSKEFFLEYSLESLNLILILLLAWSFKYIHLKLDTFLNFLEIKKNILSQGKINKINTHLAQLRKYSKGNRVLLLLNHNQEYFFNNYSFIKSTAVAENAELNLKTLLPYLKNIPQAIIFNEFCDLFFQREFNLINAPFEARFVSCYYNFSSPFLLNNDFGYVIITLPDLRNPFFHCLGYILITFLKDNYKEFKISFTLEEKLENLLLELLTELEKEN